MSCNLLLVMGSVNAGVYMSLADLHVTKYRLLKHIKKYNTHATV